jgi:predicted acyl esterase
MVQVQSSWFPLIDLNPQTYVPNIAKAPATAFVASTQKIYSATDMPSRIILSAVPNGQ